MTRTYRQLLSSAALATAASALLLGEATERYDDAHRVSYAVQNLRKRQQDARAGASAGPSSSSNDDDAIDSPAAEQKAAHSSASPTWLAYDAPKFPYLLGVSPGDDITKVIDAVLSGSTTVGASADSSAAVLRDLLTPTNALERAISATAQRWKALKASLHADVPAAFDPRASALSQSLDDVLRALETIAPAADDTAASVSSATERLMFVLRDVDALDDRDAAHWLHWTQRVTAAGLAHVVLATHKGVTPRTLAALQALHNSSTSTSSTRASGSDSDAFVAIVVRVARGAVDTSSARDKLRVLEATYQLGLCVRDDDGATSSAYDDASDDGLYRVDEASLIVDAAGNWWRDLATICQQLAQRDLGGIAVTNTHDRELLVRSVCDAFRASTTADVLQHVRLDGSLDVPHVAAAAARIAIDSDCEVALADEAIALQALATWRCLEVVTGRTTGSHVLASPQQLVQRNADTPLWSATPVAALLPFGPEREASFLQLLDADVLFLQPKTAVEIGVVPCKATDLVAPCWIETRPAIAHAFATLHRNDAYYHAVQALERIATTKTLRDEIALFAQEIDAQQTRLIDERAAFDRIEPALTKAERTARVAELALLELEVDAKRVYLDRMQTLLLA